MPKASASSTPERRAVKKERPTAKRRRTSRIDFSDIPEASDEQLRVMHRVGRPPLGDTARQLIALRIDPGVLQRIKEEAERRTVGYQTLINDILAKYTRTNIA